MCNKIERTTTFKQYFNQVPNPTPATSRPPIVTPEVGEIALIEAEAPDNAHTTISAGKPKLFAKGPKIGIETVAKPEEDGIKNPKTMNNK